MRNALPTLDVRIFIVGLLCFFCTYSAHTQVIDTFFVTNTNSFGNGSFAQAIFDANQNPSPNADSVEIHFDIPGTGPHFIEVNEVEIASMGTSFDEYYTLYQNSVRIDGTTQEGYTPENPNIVIHRVEQLDTIGLFLRGDFNTITGLMFKNFEQCINSWNISNFNIFNNVFVRDSLFAEHIITAEGEVILQNSFEFPYGIALWVGSSSDAGNGIVSNNTVRGFHRGMHFNRGRNYLIQNNAVYENSRGITLRITKDAIIENNKIGTDFAEQVNTGNYICGIKLEGSLVGIDIRDNLFIGPNPDALLTTSGNSGILFDYGNNSTSVPPRDIYIYNNCFGLANCFDNNLVASDYENAQSYHYGLKIDIGHKINVGTERSNNANIPSLAGKNIFANTVTAIIAQAEVDSLLVYNNEFFCNDELLSFEDGVNQNNPDPPTIGNVGYNFSQNNMSISGMSEPNTIVQIFAYNPYLCNDSVPNPNVYLGTTLATTNGNWQLNLSANRYYKHFFASASQFNLNATSVFSDNYDYNICNGDDNICVWPGDAYNDGTVDHKDLLPIGLFYGVSGPPRINANINWLPHPAETWGNNTLADEAYADCDGNGTIDEADIDAIYENCGNTHIPSYSNLDYVQEGNVRVRALLPERIFDREIVNIPIVIESDAPVDLYGLAFSIILKAKDSSEYILPNIAIPDSTSTLDYPFVAYDNSVVGTLGNDLIEVNKVFVDSISNQKHARWDIAFSKIDQKNASIDGGTLVELNAVMCIMEIGPFGILVKDPEQKIEVIIEDIVMSSRDGVLYTGQGDTSRITMLAEALPPVACEDSNILFNPSNQTLKVYMYDSNTDKKSIKIYNLNGNAIYNQSVPLDQNQVDIPLSYFQSGIYVINVNGGECVMRWGKY